MPYDPIYVVTVTWMHDKKEEYKCDEVRVGNGVLTLKCPHDEEYGLPLGNIRVYKIEKARGF